MENEIHTKYDKRLLCGQDKYYDLRPENIAIWEDFDSKISKKLRSIDRKSSKFLIVGVGYGAEVLLLLRYGIDLENIYCVDIRQDRINYIRHIVPCIAGAIAEPFDENSFKNVDGFDLILCSTVLSSISLEVDREVLVNSMLKRLKESGCLIIYDMTVFNYKNPDVNPIKLRWLKSIALNYEIESEKVTLIPPIARAIYLKFNILYRVMILFPFLKTHRITYIKPIR